MAGQDDAAVGTGGPSLLSRLRGLPAPVHWALAALAVLLFWYGVIGGLRAGIAPDPALRAGNVARPSGASAAVALAARLVEHEVDERAFTPNDSLLHPTAFADRTAAYQRAVTETVARLLPLLPAVAGSRDPAVAALFADAATELAVPADRARFALAWPPVRAPAEARYRTAVSLLRRANAAVAGQPPGTVQALAPALSGLAAAIAEAADEGETALRDGTGSTARILARQRGVATAAGVLLRGLREDHAAEIRAAGRAASLAVATDALDRAADVDPPVVRRRDLVESGYALLTSARALEEAARGLG